VRAKQPVLTAFDANRLAMGTFIQMNSPEACEIAARSGLDFVIIDMEHGSFGIESALQMIRATQYGGAAAFVRLDAYSRSAVLKVLDAGAVGVVVPNVESAEQLAEIIAATRYAPKGTRGACPCVRASDHGLWNWADYTSWSEQNIMVVALVETRAGLENFESIIAVEGLSAVAIGQFDLSVSMGRAGQHDHPEVVSKQTELVGIARKRGVDVLGVVFETEPAAAKAGADRWRALGARMIVVSGDRFALVSAYQRLGAALGFGG
jgi:4-hydroxy-2-oxoheptanedioate aldolase